MVWAASAPASLLNGISPGAEAADQLVSSGKTCSQMLLVQKGACVFPLAGSGDRVLCVARDPAPSLVKPSGWWVLAHQVQKGNKGPRETRSRRKRGKLEGGAVSEAALGTIQVSMYALRGWRGTWSGTKGSAPLALAPGAWRRSSQILLGPKRSVAKAGSCSSLGEQREELYSTQWEVRRPAEGPLLAREHAFQL